MNSELWDVVVRRRLEAFAVKYREWAAIGIPIEPWTSGGGDPETLIGVIFSFAEEKIDEQLKVARARMHVETDDDTPVEVEPTKEAVDVRE